MYIIARWDSQSLLTFEPDAAEAAAKRGFAARARRPRRGASLRCGLRDIGRYQNAFAKLLTIAFLVLVPVSARGDGMLLRNGDLRDDWLTLLPELKNHHWNYTTEVHGRRDYNPDGWRLSGKWEWRDADHPMNHRVVLASPSKAVQSVNWITIHNSKKLSGWPDAGGYPTPEAVRSKAPLAMVRDLTFRVQLAGKDVPKGAVTVSVSWSAACPIDDPLGAKRIATASVPAPEGTYASKTIEVILPAATWFDMAKKDPAFATQGAIIPMAATVEVSYADKQAGLVELLGATLSEPGPATPNLLANGGFENADAEGYPGGWSKPTKYSYFPPGIYYIFNTWHNFTSDNRGTAGRDTLVPHSGKSCLRMLIPTGDEAVVVSEPITLNQKEARLIEVRAWVKNHKLCMMQIDAEDGSGRRIDGFNFIHKNPLSIGTDDWRLVRQVFRPSAPLKSIRLKLCARGMNGYTLDDTGHQPQQNTCGIIWWDDVQLFEPETQTAELQARGVKTVAAKKVATEPHLENLDLGEQLIGRNEFTAEIVNIGPDATYSILLEGARSRYESDAVQVAAGKRVAVHVPYDIAENGRPYEEGPFAVSLIRTTANKRDVIASSPLVFATWTVPIDLELGALYLRPKQKQFVRANLGFAHQTMSTLKELRLEVLRRGTGQVLQTLNVPATSDAIRALRAKLPEGLRDDLRNLVITDLDVSRLPMQPFNDPERNWVLRATAINVAGKPVASVVSQPFCRLAHDGPQPAITSVKIDASGDFLINGKPWMPWGVTYGHNPVYDGPADPGKYLDLANLKTWSLYDRHGGNLSDRALWDINCLRHVEGGGLVSREKLAEIWSKGLYASTVFIKPPMAGKGWPDAHLQYLRTAPMVAAVSPGPEEAFGHFSPMDARQIKEVENQVTHLRNATGKPVMVGHGGYWTRLEFEKVPFFDIYDPETEPWYPAPLHTDMTPLVAGKPKAVWLRPQMYESVPYERWRYHVLVELMRGARGWQIAHGPGDPSLMRGLHAELRRLQPAIYSKEKPPAVTIDPRIEQMVRQTAGKTTIIAATTHGMSFGDWRWSDEKAEAGRVRTSTGAHGIQYLVDAKKWPTGSKLVTSIKIDGKSPPKSLVALVKADGRWTHVAAWGPFDPTVIRKNENKAFKFLETFYAHFRGFLGWGDKVLPHTLEFIPDSAIVMGTLPEAGTWVKLEVPLDKINAADKLLDGVGFMHDGGQVSWAKTMLVDPEGKESIVFGDHEDRPDPANLKVVKTAVSGLKKGTKVRVLFEDREIVAEEGYFIDDFSGVDLYQRFGGEGTGYGNAPVAVHVYEVGG